MKSAQSALREREAEVARLGAGLEGVEEKRKAREVRCRELEGQLQTLTLDNKALRAAHQSEVRTHPHRGWSLPIIIFPEEEC